MKLEYVYIPDAIGDRDAYEAAEKKLSKTGALSGELRRLSAKNNEKSKRESLAGLCLLASMQDLSGVFIERDEKGRPFAFGGDFDFNVSHTDDLAVCAISSARVGVDTEKIRALPDRDRFITRYFSKNEIDYIEGSNDKDEAFFRVWTRKEALLKLSGDGLTKDLRTLDTADARYAFTEKTVTFGKERYIITAIEG